MSVTPPPLDLFAEQAAVATGEDTGWLTTFVAQAKAMLPDQPDVALLRQRHRTLVPLAATADVPPLPANRLDALPQRDGGALLLPLPGVQTAALWVNTPRDPDRVQAVLAGWLAVVGANLARLWLDQQLDHQQRAQDHFFSMVNHDLKTPLSSIKAMSDLIVRKVGRGTIDPTTDEGREELTERLRFLSQRVNDMAGLIDEIGDVSAIERGRLRLTPQPVDLVSLLRGSVERVQHEQPRRIELHAPADRVIVRADPHRLAQVLHIILKNAVDYSAPDSPVSAAVSADSAEATVVVEDQGRGIAPEQQARLFQEYGRAVQQTSSGLGVGLYVAAALVEAHGGSLGLTSTPGEGTTVRLVLPQDERA